MSINANEVRIGNWLKRDSQPNGFHVDSQSFFIIEQHPNWYEPIPISEDILMACGFEKDNHRKYSTAYLKNKIRIRHLKGDNKFVLNRYGSVYLSIHTLHQLQNLFFALTGEELQIDESKLNP